MLSNSLQILGKTFMSIFILLGLINLAFLLIYPARPTQPLSSTSNACNCGDSTASALAQGCVYDSMAAAWLPPACRDPELTTIFERSGPGPNGSFLYFADPHHRVPLTLDQVAMLGDTPEARFYTTWEWHATHCYFYWWKEFRARSLGTVIEKRYNRAFHLNHCQKVLLQMPRLNAEAGVVFDSS
jgi:hypothetical protein